MTALADTTTSQEQQVSDLVDQLLIKFPPRSTPAAKFLGEQFDLGLAWVHFPIGVGGLGVSPKYQKIVNEKVNSAGGPVLMHEIRSVMECADRR